MLLVPRFRPSWPPPGVFVREAPKKTRELGAPRGPLPLLLPKSKPVSAATVRCGPDYLEVPFFATHDSHRWGLRRYLTVSASGWWAGVRWVSGGPCFCLVTVLLGLCCSSGMRL